MTREVSHEDRVKDLYSEENLETISFKKRKNRLILSVANGKDLVETLANVTWLNIFA